LEIWLYVIDVSNKKSIFNIVKVKKYNEPEVKTFYCQDCFNGMCFCHICSEKTTYVLYEKHLLEKHTGQEMAHELVNQKMSSDRM